MNEEKKPNEELREQPRRRRSASRPETEVAGRPTEVVEKITKAEETAGAEPAFQAADSRIPPEARRMTASPYGTAAPAVPRRPGTRPPVSIPRSPQEARRTAETRRSAENRRPAENQRPETERVSVGYAPGRMGGIRNPRTAQEYIQDLQNAREYGRDPRKGNAREVYGREIYSREAHERDPRDPRNYQAFQESRNGRRMQDSRGKKHPVLWILTALLLIAGIGLVVLQSLPEDHSLRVKAEDVAKSITRPVENLLSGKIQEPARIDTFTVTGNEKTTAPTDVIFSVTTNKAADKLRLVDEDGNEVHTDVTLAENTDNNCWTLTLPVKDGYEGTVKLQTRRERQIWEDTDYEVTLEIAPPLAGSDTAAAEGSRETEEIPDADDTPESESGEGSGEEPETAEDPENVPEETAEGSAEEAKVISEDYGDDLWGVPWGGKTGEETEEAEAPEETTPAPTDTPEPTPEPTPTPPLEAVADPNASPDLITTTIVYDGSKKQKNYMRAAKSLIHMPSGDDYTMKQIGVLTFRGNAFRQNAAVGKVTSATELTNVWQTEAGSSRGASQTFYGYEWTGQPAIVKWSTQVRAASNIDEEKKTKKALLEVIIAGVDGVIRFMDLEDGSLTRNAINLGYPMKGTPSVHPAGFPYMNVGQYTRKMKVKTGKIGLRQYNLYTQKELTLIDGLDGKMHRGINKYGSFETSALIDRTSDTMVTLGTNGLLYLVSLNTAFDYQAGTLKINPSTIVMSARAKGEKKDERVAVEASHAMYDRYVFYADMGGILRCVDTNYLTPVWAVDTGDAVMATIALDLNGTDGLDLYTANMLSIRKTGAAQIRRYDALSGREIWTTEIGVAKNTKTKEDVGVKASPVIGQKGLSDLVYFTVTGLNQEGRDTLHLGEEAKAALVALEKETGSIRWAVGLESRSESSPVAVYDADGNGWIIQCVEDGTILLLDGTTGNQQASLQIDGQIQASPAVYNDMMVIGTTGKGTEYVYGIRIR